MRQRVVVVALLGVLAFLLAAEAAQAQFISIGGGRRGGTSVGVYTPGFGLQYGRPAYGYGYGYGGWGGGYSPYMYSRGYYPNYNSWSYPSYNSWSYPSSSYYSSPSWSYTYPSPSYSFSNPSQVWNGHSTETAQDTAQSSYQSFYPPQQNSSAHLQVVVPDPNARVTIENTPTQMLGRERLFVSPPLESGHQYTYTIRATWMENGREVTREKTLSVQPGQLTLANFATPQDSITDKLVTPDSQRAVADQRTHEGKIVRAGDGKLIMTDTQGNNQHTHDVSSSATIMIDGKVGQLNDLKEGQTVRVTTKDDASKTVVRIEAGRNENQNQNQNQNQNRNENQNQNQNPNRIPD